MTTHDKEFFSERFREIEHKQQQLEKLMAATRTDLDNALASLPGLITTAVQAALAANPPTGTPDDFTAEIATINAIPAQVASAVAPAPAS